MRDVSSHAYPLLEREKLLELKRVMSLGEGVIVHSWLDNASGVFPRPETGVSTRRGVSTAGLSAARAGIASCAVAVTLAATSLSATGDQTQGVPYPERFGTATASAAPAVTVVSAERVPADAEFKWNRSTYRARKKAKEYGS